MLDVAKRLAGRRLLGMVAVVLPVALLAGCVQPAPPPPPPPPQPIVAPPPAPPPVIRGERG